MGSCTNIDSPEDIKRKIWSDWDLVYILSEVNWGMFGWYLYIRILGHVFHDLTIVCLCFALIYFNVLYL